MATEITSFRDLVVWQGTTERPLEHTCITSTSRSVQKLSSKHRSSSRYVWAIAPMTMCKESGRDVRSWAKCYTRYLAL